MAKRLEAIKDYLGSVADRTMGRQAWVEAMQQPNEPSSYAYTKKQPSWARGLNRALYQGAPASAALEFIAPAISRVVFPIVEGNKENQILKNDYLNTGLIIPALITDISTNMFAIIVGRNPLEGTLLKLTANAATHVGLDIYWRCSKKN